MCIQCILITSEAQRNIKNLLEKIMVSTQKVIGPKKKTLSLLKQLRRMLGKTGRRLPRLFLGVLTFNACIDGRKF
jgi:hypothetical protein